MSLKHIAGLRGAMAADPELATRFAALSTVELAIAAAADLGFHVTAEELAEVLDTRQELSDVELEGAAGGTSGNLYCLTLACSSIAGAGQCL